MTVFDSVTPNNIRVFYHYTVIYLPYDNMTLTFLVRKLLNEIQT
jgi:hypothetical protein